MWIFSISLRQIWAAAVIEHGEAFVKDSSEVVKAKDLVNISAALGINSSCSIRWPRSRETPAISRSHGGRACQITILDRRRLRILVLRHEGGVLGPHPAVPQG